MYNKMLFTKTIIDNKALLYAFDRIYCKIFIIFCLNIQKLMETCMSANLKIHILVNSVSEAYSRIYTLQLFIVINFSCNCKLVSISWYYKFHPSILKINMLFFVYVLQF